MSLRVEQLTKRYQGKALFQNLTFSAEGPAVLWAPSGWGKTTLLRILMGLEAADAGEGRGGGRGGGGAEGANGAAPMGHREAECPIGTHRPHRDPIETP